VQRFRHPAALDGVGLGPATSTVATAVTGAMGILLLRTGASHRWVTLTADDKHLLTDVWTSFGVIVGVLLVCRTVNS
jgi:divalent metal cation (Fe/Co/Zn/Cd) transporter